MMPLAFAAILAGVVLVIASSTASSIASVAQGSPDHANAKAPSGTGAAGVAGGSSANPILAAAHEFDGLLPAGAKVLSISRRDQGRDLQLVPGQALLSTGDAEVLRVGSDPAGFGPDYPILRMLTGPFAGKDVYYGHTDASVAAGERVKAGQVVAHTSTSGHNAPPGWLEFGFAPGGSPGPFGQPVPF